jgi:sigma-B regulation protein RsbU (phosphoserine phosphatase)
MLEWVNAGHCAPFVLSAGGAIKQLSTTGMPLGLWRNTRYTVDRMQLVPGDKILVYSDGITEAENDRKETFEPRLNQLLKQCGPLDAQQIHERLIGEIVQFYEGTKPRDDITALVLEYRGLESVIIHRDQK